MSSLSLLAVDGLDTSDAAFAHYAARGLAVALAASFGVGVVSSLTPCVFPMVPITVALFGATDTKSRARGAALSAVFVLGIAVLFTVLGVFSALSGKLLGSALGNRWVVMGMASLFFLLASSCFGAFEMALPSALQQRLATVGGVGFRGAFVLGLAMGLVAMPCTGPFLTGLAVWIATTKSVAIGAANMFAFSLGLGLLFFLTGTFAVSLPRAGAWMLGIKWASGVALAYMGFAFLRDVFPWVQGLVLPGTLVVGVIASVVGFGLAAVHLVAERRGSRLAHRSRFFKVASIAPAVFGVCVVVTWIGLPKGAPLAWWTHEPQARERALAEGKPVLVDFGASWCVACKELETRTFLDPRVRAEGERFVAIRVDATDDEAPEIRRLSAKYRAVGLPTVVLFDSLGQEQERFHEFVAPERFVEAMRRVR